MSEIKRYDNVNGGSIACHECYMDESSDGDYVRHADHAVYLNEAKLELSAAQSELAALREELATARSTLDYRSGLLSKAEQRLTVAEQRNALLTELVNDVVKAFKFDPAGSCYNPGISFVRPWSVRAAKLLTKPTESGASEEKRKTDFIRLNSAPHCPECGHPDCNGQCYGDDMMGASE